jgi:ligand-binding sensor domain-containing protein/anti-sigma regulatory factor (Ser/Thr protein kinase)
VSFNLKGQYLFKNLNEDHGLGTNVITCLLKDKQGFIWMGTENGLFRFDGSELMAFYSHFNDSTSLSENYIISIFQALNGEIWIGTRNGGINVLDPVSLKFHVYNADPDDSTSISDDVSKLIFEDKYGNIVIAVRDKGIDIFNHENGGFSNFRPTGQYPDLDKNLANEILCFTYDPLDKNIIWMGTLEGIFSFDLNTKKWKHFPVDEEHVLNPGLFSGREDIVRTLLFDSNRFLWFGSWGGGLCKMNVKTGDFEIFKYEKLNPVNGIRNNISKLINKKENEFWFIAPHRGLGVFNLISGEFTFIKDYNGKTPISAISDAAIDNEGFMYVSTFNKGLFYCNLQSQIFNRVNMPYSLIAMGSTGCDSTLLVSTYSPGAKLMELNKKTKHLKKFTYRPIHDYNDNNFLNILSNGDKTWLAEQLNLYYFDRNSLSIQPYKQFDPLAILPNNSHVHNFLSSSIDQNGVIWLGSKFNGLFKVNTNSGLCENIYYSGDDENTPLFNGFIFTLFTDSKNRTWYGSGNFGYYDPSNNSFVHFDYSIDFKNSDVKLKHIYGYTETNDGLVWIGTQQAGIAVINPNEKPPVFVKSYTMRNGLQSNNIYDMKTDKEGNVWVLTQKGVSRIFWESGNIENYGEDYGIINSRSLHLEEDGELYIVAGKGYYHFYPELISPVVIDIKPYIKNFRIFDDAVEISAFDPKTKLMELDYDQNFFSIEFGAINYFEQEAVKYEYMLKGLDNQWHDAGDRKYISYTNLNGGDYVFRLKVTGSDELSIPIFIHTPFWKTWWFYVMLFVVLSGIVLSIYSYRLKQIREQEELKTAYDRKISQLEIKALRAQMNPHFLFNSLNSIRYYILKEDHQNASAYITKFSRLLRLILTNSRHSKISLEDELHALDIYIDFELMRFNNKFDYKITVAPELNQQEIKIQPMTIQPFVENAIWHGLMPKNGDRSLLVDVSLTDSVLKIIVEDNGIGRQAAKKLSESGLENTKSYGMQITEDRMNMMKNITGKMSGFKIVDLFENRHPIGTRVIVTFEV